MIKNGTDEPIQVLITTAGGLQMFEGDTKNLELLLRTLGEKPTMVEIGTWTGHSATFLATYAKNRGGELHCVDTFDGNGSVLEETARLVKIEAILEENLERAGVRNFVQIHKMNSLEAVELFADKSIDFLFLDGDHRYQQLSLEITKWLPKVRGIICGHDYDIDAYNLVFPEDRGRVTYEHLEDDCVLYPWQDNKKIAVHYGVLKAVHENFPNTLHYGRIWWKDFRQNS